MFRSKYGEHWWNRPDDYTIAVKSSGRLELWAGAHGRARLAFRHPRCELYLLVCRGARVDAGALAVIDRFVLSFVQTTYQTPQLLRRVDSQRGPYPWK